MKKQLLFIGNTRLGDAVMSTGLLASLCNNYSADATVVCGKVAVPIFKSFPNVKNIIQLNKKKYSMHWFEIWKEVKKIKWDIVCDLRNTPIIWFISAKKRIILSPKESKTLHRIARLHKISPDKNQPIPKVWISSRDKIEAKSYIKDSKGPYVVIGPTANWNAKIWPAEKFAELLKRIITYRLFTGATFILVGGPGEENIGKEVESLSENIKIINLIGKPIMPTAAIFTLSKIFIGNDSGLMHLAAATGIPTLGLFGPTDDKLYAPSGKNCMTVRTPETPSELMDIPSFDHRTSGSLMNTLNVSVVEKAFLKLLSL